MGKAPKVASTRPEARRVDALGRTRVNHIGSLTVHDVKSLSTFQRILAIDPTTSGFAFIVLEGGERLVDWGVARVWAESENEYLARIEAIVQRYSPSWLVVENAMQSRRGTRARRRIALLLRYAKSQKMIATTVSWEAVRQALGQAVNTKYEIASTIANRFPELAIHLPKRRRAWESEDPRMNIFDATAIALAAWVSPGSDLPLSIR